MQFKLLNFHRVLANLSTNLTGVFIPIIIYNTTKSLQLTFLYLILAMVLRILMVDSLRKLLLKYTHLSNLLRVFPIVLKYLCLIFLNLNFLVMVILYSLFDALSMVLKHVPNELIYNYSTFKKGSNTLGTTIMFEKIGQVVALIFSGFFLDHFNQNYLLLISLIIYLISSLPLVIYYYKNRGKTEKEVLRVEDVPLVSKKESRMILLRYLFLIVLFSTFDATPVLFNLLLFINGKTFTVVGIINALFLLMQGITSYFVSRNGTYKHIKIVTYISIVILSIATVSIPFIIDNTILLYINYIVRGLLNPIVNVYIYSNLLNETRKLGISNKAVMVRLNSIYLGSTISFVLPLIFTIPSSFIGIGILMLFSSVFLSKRREKLVKTS